METNLKLKGFNHFALSVKDLALSISFYSDVMGFKVMDRPSFDFPGAWMDIGNGLQLHLIECEDKHSYVSGSRSLHFAFAVDDIQEIRKQLIHLNISIVKDIKSRPDGSLQLFICDPDGYYIEFTQIDFKAL